LSALSAWNYETGSGSLASLPEPNKGSPNLAAQRTGNKDKEGRGGEPATLPVTPVTGAKNLSSFSGVTASVAASVGLGQTNDGSNNGG